MSPSLSAQEETWSLDKFWTCEVQNSSSCQNVLRGRLFFCVCMCGCTLTCVWAVDLRDSTLGKGEVLHQNVQSSVLIIQELAHPPVNTHSL